MSYGDDAMRPSLTKGLLLVPTVSLIAVSAQASDIAALLADGTAALSFRYRYEFVDDEAFSRDAKASTLRSRLSFQSGSYRDAAFFIEVEDIRDIIADDFNAGAGNTPLEVFNAVLDRMGVKTGVDVFKLMDVAEELIVPLMDQPIRVDRDSLIMGYAGVYSRGHFEYATPHLALECVGAGVGDRQPQHVRHLEADREGYLAGG